MRNFSLALVLLMMSTLGFAADGGSASGLTNPESHKTEIKNHIKQNKKDIKGRIKNELKDAKDKGASDTEILLIILAILLPPLAVYLLEDGVTTNFWIDLLLTLLLWLPGVIFALILILS